MFMSPETFLLKNVSTTVNCLAKFERTIIKLLGSVLWQCKEKQYLDQFITLLLFSDLLVAPFLENVILEELLAGGMVV